MLLVACEWCFSFSFSFFFLREREGERERGGEEKAALTMLSFNSDTSSALSRMAFVWLARG